MKRILAVTALLFALAAPSIPAHAEDEFANHLYLPAVMSAPVEVDGSGGSGITPIRRPRD